MAWNNPSFHLTGDVITAADYNHRYYNERYLKGKDGDITLDDHIAGTAYAGFAGGVGTHTHASAGAEGGALPADAFAGNINAPGYVRGTSPNSGTTGTIRLRAASADPDTMYLQAINNAEDTEYCHLQFKKNGALLPSGNIEMAGGSTVDGVDLSALDTAVDTATLADVSGSRAIDSTIYQNTSGKIVLAVVSVACTVEEQVDFFIGAASPPTSGVGVACSHLAAGETLATTITFIIPSGYYYKAVATEGTPTLMAWMEYTLH